MSQGELRQTHNELFGKFWRAWVEKIVKYKNKNIAKISRRSRDSNFDKKSGAYLKDLPAW